MCVKVEDDQDLPKLEWVLEFPEPPKVCYQLGNKQLVHEPVGDISHFKPLQFLTNIRLLNEYMVERRSYVMGVY